MINCDPHITQNEQVDVIWSVFRVLILNGDGEDISAIVTKLTHWTVTGLNAVIDHTTFAYNETTFTLHLRLLHVYIYSIWYSFLT